MGCYFQVAPDRQSGRSAMSGADGARTKDLREMIVKFDSEQKMSRAKRRPYLETAR